MNPIYDVAILGCGEAGIFAAYELAHHRPGLQGPAPDPGRGIHHPRRPIVAGEGGGGGPRPLKGGVPPPYHRPHGCKRILPRHPPPAFSRRYGGFFRKRGD